MKKFRVYYFFEASAYADVEAENEEEAKNKIIYGDYDNEQIIDGTSNQIDDVEEITEETK